VDEKNAADVFRSLKEFGAPLADMTETDFSEEGYFYQMGRSPMRVDILMGIPGLAFEHMIPVQMHGLPPQPHTDIYALGEVLNGY